MRKLQLIICAIVLSMWAIAQDYETIYTTSGAIYKGYISEQVPGKEIFIYATDVILSLPNDGVNNIREEYRKVEELSFAAQRYFYDKGDSIYVKLLSLRYNDEIYDNVLKINQTSDSLFIRMFNTKTYILPWKSVLNVEKHVENDSKDGLIDVITLKTGEVYSGKVINQVIGSDLTLQAPDTILDIKLSSIEKIEVKSEDRNEFSTDMLVLIPLLDRIVLKDNSILEGFIISRIMGKSINIFTFAKGECVEIPLSYIDSYQKTQNPIYLERYVEQEDDIMKVCIDDKMSCDDLIY